MPDQFTHNRALVVGVANDSKARKLAEMVPGLLLAQRMGEPGLVALDGASALCAVSRNSRRSMDRPT